MEKKYYIIVPMSSGLLNKYKNAAAIYANRTWTYYSPRSRIVAVLFDANKMPFFYKNGKRQTFTTRKNSNGENQLYFGPGSNNYLLNTPSNAKKVFAHYKKFSKTYYLKKRSPKNTVAEYKTRTGQMRGQTKIVNKLVRNVKAGRNITKADTANLLALVMRYQKPNAGAYYHRTNRGRILGNNGKKPTRKQLLANIAQFKNNNMFK